MPYELIIDRLPNTNLLHGTRIYISINRNAFRNTEIHKKIKTILIKHLTYNLVHVKILAILNENSPTHLHDIISEKNLTYDDGGREVCIVFGNHENNFYLYKDTLLTLWKEFQRQGIPLTFQPSSFSQIIPVQPHFCSPFSFDQLNDEAIANEEIIFKQSDQNDNVLRQLTFTEKDLNGYRDDDRIAYDHYKLLSDYDQYFHSRYDMAIKGIQTSIQAIKPSKTISKEDCDNTLTLFKTHPTLSSKPKLDTIKTIPIDWSDYFSDISGNKKEPLYHGFAQKNPLEMKKIYRRILWLEREKQAYSKYKDKVLAGTYPETLYQSLINFRDNIHQLTTNKEVIKQFRHFYSMLEIEMLLDKDFISSKRQETYRALIQHFSDIAQQLNKGKLPTPSELSKSFDQLDKKLFGKPKMSKALTMAAGLLVFSLIATAIGFAVAIPAISFNGGFGALATAVQTGAIFTNKYMLRTVAAGGIFGLCIASKQVKRDNARRQEALDKFSNLRNRSLEVYQSFGRK